MVAEQNRKITLNLN